MIGHRTRAEMMKRRTKKLRDRRAIATRIVRDRKLRTMAEAKRFAREWIICAMSYADASDFYREQNERAFKRGVATERRRQKR